MYRCNYCARAQKRYILEWVMINNRFRFANVTSQNTKVIVLLIREAILFNFTARSCRREYSSSIPSYRLISIVFRTARKEVKRSKLPSRGKRRPERRLHELIVNDDYTFKIVFYFTLHVYNLGTYF